MIKEGERAPDFNLDGTFNDEQKKYSLTDFSGKWVVLYFYPKDDTPGCTKEACDFRDSLPLFKDKNAVIVGVSKDSAPSHHKFSTKYGLPFILLSDPEKKLCEAYGVMKEKSLYGKTYIGVDRSTFLINPEGIVEKVWRGVKVDGHIQTVLASIT